LAGRVRHPGPVTDRTDGSGQPSKAWFWSGRDPSSLHDIVIVVAVGSRKEVQAASVRLGLPKPEKLQPMAKSQPGYDLALAEPGHVFWMDADDFMLRPRPPWRREDELGAMRKRATARRHIHGHRGVPIRRPD
jgi:hypothetical protein